MIRCDISKSRGFASLSPEAAVLFCLAIPHFNSYGKMNGEPHFIKGEVCPLIPWFTIEKIEYCLKEISDRTNVKYHESGGLKYLQALNWKEHQDLREDRLGADLLPSYPLQDNSGTAPGELPLEVEVISKSIKRKKEGSSASTARPSLEEVKDYFSANNFEVLEADAFFDHFESNGWLVAGKSPMKNWQAAARNWNRNAIKFGGKRGFQAESKARRKYASAESVIAKQNAD